MADYEIPEQLQAAHTNLFETSSKQYEYVLDDLQIVLIVDRSGSMRIEDEDGSGGGKTRGMMGNWTRWDNTFQILKFLAESIFMYDKDSRIPVVFFGHRAIKTEATSVQQLFDLCFKHKPTNETTNLLAALRTAFSSYLQNENENVLFVVITDGCPNAGQEETIKDLIYKVVSSKDPNGDRLNLLFLRVGDDSGAIRFLEEMDDCAMIGENVDTKSDNDAFAMGPRNLILNAIFEHLENSPLLQNPSSSSSSSSSSFPSSGFFSGNSPDYLKPSIMSPSSSTTTATSIFWESFFFFSKFW